jgi:hypothetical protein
MSTLIKNKVTGFFKEYKPKVNYHFCCLVVLIFARRPSEPYCHDIMDRERFFSFLRSGILDEFPEIQFDNKGLF